MDIKFTIKTRLTLWYIIILTVILLAFSGLIYGSMKKYMFVQVEDVLRTHAEQILHEFENKGFDEEGNTTLFSLKNELEETQDKEVVIGIYNNNKTLITTKRIPGIMTDEITIDKEYLIKDGKKDDQDWAVLTLPIRQDGKTIGWIRLARLLENEERILNRLILILLFGLPFTLLIASSGGYFLAWKALLPIDRITRTARDISHHNLGQRIEERETNDEIGRLVGTLNQLLNRLETAFKREKQFTADASHELRTPITVIRAQAEKGIRSKGSVEEYQHILKVVENQSEHMTHLIDQLLLLARGDMDQQILNKEYFDLNELIRMVSDEIKEMAVNKGVEFTVKTIDKELMIYADQSMLIQLLLNLLDNALKYTPPGGRVKVEMVPVESGVKIKVIDTGVGISQEEQESIFERFYRVDKARSRKRGGTGLGLAICRWIVEAHGGSIDVSSKPGEGSIFTICFPEISS